MKNIISLLLMISLMLSMSGCETALNDEVGTILPDTQEDSNSSSEQTISQTDIPSESTFEENEHTHQDVEKEQIIPETEITQETFTEQDVFSEYEVIVVLKKLKKRKLSDFPEADAFAIVQHNNYFTENFHPEYMDKIVYSLILNNPSKTNVLETVKRLADNKYVEYCAPSYLTYNKEYFYLVVSGKDEKIYTEQDFEGMDIILDNGEEYYYQAVKNYPLPEPGFCNQDAISPPRMSYVNYEGNPVIRMKPKEQTEKAVYEQLKIASKLKNVVEINPVYHIPREDAEIVAYVYPEHFPDEFTMDFFHYLDGEIINIETYHNNEGYLNYNDGPVIYKQIFIKLNDVGREIVMKSISSLNKDKRVFNYEYFSNEYDYIQEYNEINKTYISIEYDPYST